MNQHEACPTCGGSEVVEEQIHICVAVCCGAGINGECCGNPVPEEDVATVERPCPDCCGTE